jgi:hypothetical protein
MERVGVDPVMRLQQPACAALLHFVQPVTGGRLRDLIEQRYDVAFQNLIENRHLLQGAQQIRCLDLQAGARDLNQHPARHRVGAQQKRHTDHPFPTDRRELDDVAALRLVDHRNDARRREIRERDRLVGFGKDLSVGKFDFLQIRAKTREFVRWRFASSLFSMSGLIVSMLAMESSTPVFEDQIRSGYHADRMLQPHACDEQRTAGRMEKLLPTPPHGGLLLS